MTLRRFVAATALIGLAAACAKKKETPPAPAFAPQPLVASAELAAEISACETEAKPQFCFAKLVETSGDAALCERAGGGTLAVSLCVAKCAKKSGDWRFCDLYRGTRVVRGVGSEGWVVDADCYLGAVTTKGDPAACDHLERRWSSEEPTDAGTDLERRCAKGPGWTDGLNCDEALLKLAEGRREEDLRRAGVLAACRSAP